MDKQLQAHLEASGHAASDHFRGVTKMVELGGGSKREIDERASFALSI